MTMSKCYVLILRNNKQFLSVFDEKLNPIASRGKKVQNITDPFYFSLEIRKIHVQNEKIFIMEREQFKIMSELTGEVEASFAVLGTTFSLYKEQFLLTLDNDGHVYYYDISNGRNILKLKTTNDSKSIFIKRISSNKIFVFSRSCNSQFVMLNWIKRFNSKMMIVSLFSSSNQKKTYKN